MFGGNDFLAPEGARNLSPVVLAFVGDAVYSLYVREKLVRETDYKTGTLAEGICPRAERTGRKNSAPFNRGGGRNLPPRQERAQVNPFKKRQRGRIQPLDGLRSAFGLFVSYGQI